MAENNNRIEVKMEGGHLVATKHEGLDYKGIYIAFEADNGEVIEIIAAEMSEEIGKDNLKVYCYQDPSVDEPTDTYLIKNEDLITASNY